MDVKIECSRPFTLCQGCLSSDRKIAAVTDLNKDLFFKLRDDGNVSQNDTKQLQLCWECNTLLNKMRSFQSQIKSAQYRLMRYLQAYCNQENSVSSLSQLKTTHRRHYDHEFHYNEPKNEELPQKDNQQYEADNSIDCDIKLENDDTIKEEYESNDIDTEFFEPELKVENDLELHVDRKPSKSDIKRLPIKIYEQYATITKNNDICPNKIKQYYETVFLNEKEVEEVLDSDRKSMGYNRMPFKCKECRIGYKRKLDLLRHNAYHHNNSKYPSPCMACNTIMESDSHLEEHWREHSRMYRCSLCDDLSRSKGEIRKHLNRKHATIYSCNSCRQELRTLREFSNHYKMVHERVICDYCNSNFTSKKKLESHIKRNHLPAYCSICNRNYRTYHVFENHVRTYHPELGSCDTRQELCYCVECDKQYSSVYRYKRHLQQSTRHTPRKKIRVPCPGCDKIFTRTAYMNNHYRLVHMKDSKHYCDICNKFFATGYGVRKHVQHVHQKMTLPKDKICDLCGRGFSTNRILTNHRRTHTGERPFKCKYCPATFAQETAMKTHQKTQHKNFIQTS